MSSPVARAFDLGGFQLANPDMMARYDKRGEVPFRRGKARLIGMMPRPSTYLPYSGSDNKRDMDLSELAKRSGWDMALADDLDSLPAKGL